VDCGLEEQLSIGKCLPVCLSASLPVCLLALLLTNAVVFPSAIVPTDWLRCSRIVKLLTDGRSTVDDDDDDDDDNDDDGELRSDYRLCG